MSTGLARSNGIEHILKFSTASKVRILSKPMICSEVGPIASLRELGEALSGSTLFSQGRAMVLTEAAANRLPSPDKRVRPDLHRWIASLCDFLHPIDSSSASWGLSAFSSGGQSTSFRALSTAE